MKRLAAAIGAMRPGVVLASSKLAAMWQGFETCGVNGGMIPTMA